MDDCEHKFTHDLSDDVLMQEAMENGLTQDSAPEHDYYSVKETVTTTFMGTFAFHWLHSQFLPFVLFVGTKRVVWQT